ncbi:protein LNK3-like isoform X1 [Senna tora]|uniref:Protein LNK3-like isoform X1 n=1 Tax=Senna tora TaxID=362788 RepID=A0A835CET3_9FABA|nr:protein LNK3-like isoform X1 [Senna tora]
MDWYYGSGISDHLVPRDEDVWDRLPSPDSWSKWGISAPEGFNLPKRFSIMDTNPREVEFNFDDESFNNEIELESSLHEKDQSSSSSVCGGLLEQSFQQAALSCDQPNYQLQDLSRFEHMDDIFLDSMLEALPNVENLNKALCFSPKPQFNNTPGGLQKDIAASKFVPCNSKYEDCLDVEASPVKLLDPFEQSSIDEGTHQQSSLEESILLDLEMAIAQFTEKTRLCFRDALYRLARNTTQQHVVQDQDGDLNMQREMAQTDHNETVRSEDNKPMESETNSVDRAIANLMFNKMDVNVQDLPLTTSANSKKEGTRTKSPQGKASKASNQTQQHFYHPYSLNLQGGTEVPRFNQSEQRTASKSHIMYRDPTKKSFMLEFG